MTDDNFFEDQNLLLQSDNLHVKFDTREGVVHAVRGVNLTIRRSETIGIVGESGCGKSVTAQAILRIIPKPGQISEGRILYRQEFDKNMDTTIDLAQLDDRGSQIRSIRGGDIAYIFQEPMSSLSPVHTIGDQIIEGILLHQDVSKKKARQLAIDMLDKVGIPKPEQRVDMYSFELSGGMRQRAMIASALACKPSLLIADEPTTALDVTIQAQILELLQLLQQELGMAIILITHNLGVVAAMADRIAVMYLGRIVEETDKFTLFREPKHPYTKGLLRSLPRLGQKQEKRLWVIKGMVPPPYAQISGCAFHPRCPDCMPGVCDQQVPEPVEITPGHMVACHLFEGEEKGA